MNAADIEIRLVFRDEATRHAFMMKALDKEDFVYRLAGGKSIFMSNDNVARLKSLAKKFGGVAEKPERPVADAGDQIPDREERVKAWNALVEEIHSLKVA